MRVIMMAAVVLAVSVRAEAQTQTVVFVCEHGAAKSVVAAAHFNKLAVERGLPFRAVSRGTAPDPGVPAAIRNGLASEKLSMPAAFKPTAVAASEVAAASRVVTFDVTVPVSDSSKLSRWDQLPAFSDGYAAASAAIAGRIDALVNELAAAARRKQ